MTPSGPVGGTPMVSRPGKATIAQYICFSNGIPDPPSAADKLNLFDPSTRPTEAIKTQIIKELQMVQNEHSNLTNGGVNQQRATTNSAFNLKDRKLES